MKRRVVVWSAVGSVVIAGISAVAALTGARLGAQATLESSRQQSQATLESSRQQLQEDRATEIREQRAKVYAEYLQAAEKYSIATGTMLTKFKQQTQAARGKPFKPDAAVLATFYAARNTYQDQVNQVYVYGSDEGWKAHQVMAGVLPRSLGDLDLKAVDSDKFLAAYQNFQSVFCLEAPAIPRSGCGEH